MQVVCPGVHFFSRLKKRAEKNSKDVQMKQPKAPDLIKILRELRQVSRTNLYSVLGHPAADIKKKGG